MKDGRDPCPTNIDPMRRSPCTSQEGTAQENTIDESIEQMHGSTSRNPWSMNEDIESMRKVNVSMKEENEERNEDNEQVREENDSMQRDTCSLRT
jgi:hypothetical protein